MRFVLSVRPGDISNNSRLVPILDRRGRFQRLGDSREYRAGLGSMALQIRSQRNAKGWPTLTGRCMVTAISYWPTWQGDVDANSKAILDCLQQGGAVENDRQIKPATFDRETDPKNPRVEITLTEIDVSG